MSAGKNRDITIPEIEVAGAGQAAVCASPSSITRIPGALAKFRTCLARARAKPHPYPGWSPGSMPRVAKLNVVLCWIPISAAVPWCYGIMVLVSNLPCLQRVVVIGNWHVGWKQRNLTTIQIGRPLAVVHRFNGCQRTVFVHRIAHTRQVRDVFVRPEAPLSCRRNVTRGMDVDLFC